MTESTAGPQLTISGPASIQGLRYGLAGAEILVGRAPSAGIRLDHPTVSRRHALLIRDGSGHVTIQDLESTAGTFVNGERLSRLQILASGDELRFGNVVARFADAGLDQTVIAPAVTAPVPDASPTPAARMPDQTSALGEDWKAVLGEAKRAFGVHRWAESAAAFERLTGSSAHSAEAYYGLGLIELQTGSTVRAEQLFRESLARDSKFANSWYQLGQIWEARSVPKALILYQAALEINPGHVSARARVQAIQQRHASDEMAVSAKQMVSPSGDSALPPSALPPSALPPSALPPSALPPSALGDVPDLSDAGRGPRDRMGLDDGAGMHTRASLRETAVESFLRNDQSPLSKQAIALIDRLAVKWTRLNISAHLGRMLVITIASLIVSAALQVAADQIPASAASVTHRACFLIWALWLIMVASVSIRQYTSMVTIANGRIYLRTGIFHRRTLTLDIWTVENIQLEQSLLNRLTRDGTLVFTGTHIGRSDGFSRKGFKLAGVARGSDLQLLYQQLEDLKFVLRANPIVKGIIS